MKNRKNKGFTLVELLGVIVIIGIISVISIAAVTRLIEKSRREQLSSQKKTIKMAAENYLQVNRGFLPKSIGDNTTIDLYTLRNSNYLKDDIYNAKGQPCMKKSYVVVYKETSTKYKYDVKLYCGNEEPSEPIDKIKPKIDVVYYYKNATNGKDEIITSSDSEGLAKVADPRYRITISGCGDDVEDPTPDKCAIEGYNYSIAVGDKVVFSSGTLSANKETKLIIAGDNNGAGVNGSLKDYFDITTLNKVVIYATARNASGVVTEGTFSLEGNNSSSIGNENDTGKTYKDNKPPRCPTEEEMDGLPGANEWINKENIVPNRTITIPCRDGDGESGCVRSSYTKTWNVSKNSQLATGIIRIKDNAGNHSDCNVRLNIDIESPEVTIGAYRKGVDETTNLLTKSSKINPSSKVADDKITINYNDYAQLENSAWMNKSKFPNGVKYKINVKDEFISGYTWKVNATKQKTVNTKSISVNNPGGEQKSLSNCGKSTGGCNFEIGFSSGNNKGEGFRYGELVISDKAGNKVTYYIYAKIDITPPNGVSVENSYFNPNNTNRCSGWVNSNNNNYSLKLNAADDVSGLQKWKHKYNSESSYTDYQKSGVSPFNTPSFKDEGEHVVDFVVCDNANNCSTSVSTKIRIDNSAPQFTLNNIAGNYVDKNDSNKSKSYSNGTWVNSNSVSTKATGAIDVISNCIKVYKYSVSGATTKPLKDDSATSASFTVTNEGSSSVNYVACDVAGNCSAPVAYNVNIDRTKPSCIISGQSTSWTRSDRYISVGCSDPGSSNNCVVDGTVKRAETFQYSTTKKVDSKVIRDAAKNTNTCNYNVYVDKTVPRCGTASGAPAEGNWTRNDRTINLGCIEGTDESGCQQKVYPRTHSTTLKKYTERIYDAVGNYSDCEYNVYVDKTPPSCGTASNASSSWRHNSPLTINLACNDNGQSGCVQNTYSQPFVKSTKTFTQTITDKVGNSRDCPYNVYLDVDVPECVESIWNKKKDKDGNVYYQVIAKCEDEGGSNCKQSTYETTAKKLTSTPNVTISDHAGNTYTCTLESSYYTLKYNDNGGKGCSSKSKKALKGQAWGDLCKPTRDGYNFGGWYKGSTKVTKNSKANKSMTVKAKWYKKSFNIDIYYWAAGKSSNCKKDHSESRFSGTRFNNRPHRVFTFKKYAITCTHNVKKMGKAYEYEVTKINQTEQHNFDGEDTTGIFYDNSNPGVAACKAGSNSYVTDVCYSENGKGNYDSHPHKDIGGGNKRTEFHGYWFFTETAQDPFSTFEKGWYHSRGRKQTRYTKSNKNTEDTRKAAAKESCEIVKGTFID